jgi:MarR family 2-MHQ and catechol resistance regulon transcriptional repressor
MKRTRRRSDSTTPASPPAARRTARSRASAGEATTPAGDDALRLWVVLARAFSAVSRHVEADIARHGLTTAEFGILEALYHKGPLLLGELQRKILVSSGGVTYLVDRLATKGLAERRECPEDRRARYAALTPAGESLIRRIFPEHARSIARALAGLTPEEQARATALLRTLGRAAAELPSEGGGS